MYKEIEGDLIKLGLEGNFDVISHGCNCFCTMQAGIAPQMVKTFGTDRFELEKNQYKGNINKLGQIDWEYVPLLNTSGNVIKNLIVVNSYTQFYYGKNHTDGVEKPVDYEAITMCMRKINHIFKGKHIGLPYVIGCGLAGGDINIVLPIIKRELKDMDVTMVKYNKK